MKKQNLLIEIRSQETPVVAVLSDVDMTNLPLLKQRIGEALMDHYDTDAVTCGSLPERVADTTYPIFSATFIVEDGESKYTDIAEITPIHIYS